MLNVRIPAKSSGIKCPEEKKCTAKSHIGKGSGDKSLNIKKRLLRMPNYAKLLYQKHSQRS